MSAFDSLPDEILIQVISYLDIKNVKQLRLSCRRTCSLCTLKFDRIFLSPAKRNLQVFHNILDQNSFCEQVKEIVYDDARFKGDFDDEWSDSDTDEMRGAPEKGVYESELELAWAEFVWNLAPEPKNQPQDPVEWYLASYDALNHTSESQSIVSTSESLDLYRQLYQEQKTIIDNDETYYALIKAFSMLPNLEKITVTTETYDPDYTISRHPTPLLRSFPRGFRMPPPPNWECDEGRFRTRELPREYVDPWYKAKHKWHGYLTVVRAISEAGSEAPRLKQLLVDTLYGLSGIGHQMFDQPSKNLTDSCNAFKRLTVLELPLFTNGYRETDEGCFRSGLLRETLSAASNLERLKLFATNETYDDNYTLDDVVPWLDYIPLASFPDLKTLSLGNLLATEADMLEFIQKMPKGLKRLELRSIGFPEQDFDWEYFLNDNKRLLASLFMLDGRSFCIGVDDEYMRHYTICADSTISEFLHGRGENPFEEDSVRYGMGYFFSVRDETAQLPWTTSNPERVWTFKRKPLDSRSIFEIAGS